MLGGWRRALISFAFDQPSSTATFKGNKQDYQPQEEVRILFSCRENVGISRLGSVRWVPYDR